MSRLVKSAGVAFVLLAAWAVYVGFSGIAMAGSGGLGAVSFGISEALLALLVLSAVVWVLLFLRSRFSVSTPGTRR
jgi:hypothetical protein